MSPPAFPVISLGPYVSLLVTFPGLKETHTRTHTYAHTQSHSSLEFLDQQDMITTQTLGLNGGEKIGKGVRTFSF